MSLLGRRGVAAEISVFGSAVDLAALEDALDDASIAEVDPLHSTKLASAELHGLVILVSTNGALLTMGRVLRELIRSRHLTVAIKKADGTQVSYDGPIRDLGELQKFADGFQPDRPTE
jgi:hypothetical protein